MKTESGFYDNSSEVVWMRNVPHSSYIRTHCPWVVAVWGDLGSVDFRRKYVTGGGGDKIRENKGTHSLCPLCLSLLVEHVSIQLSAPATMPPLLDKLSGTINQNQLLLL